MRSLLWFCTLLIATVAILPAPAHAQTITEIIDELGDGEGNPLDSPRDLAVSFDGVLAVIGVASDNAFRILPDGDIKEIIDETGDGLGNPLDSPTDVVIDDAGNFYVAGQFTNNVFKITPGGTITEIIDETGDGLGNPLERPLGIAVDRHRNVFVAGFESNNVFKITSGGIITEIAHDVIDTVIESQTKVGGPFAVAVDRPGNVFVAAWVDDFSPPSDNRDKVIKITPGGTLTEIIDETGDNKGNPLTRPFDLAVDRKDNVYVTGALSDNAFKIRPGGGITEIIDSLGDGSMFSSLSFAYGITVDRHLNVFVAGFNSFNAFVIFPDGSIATIIDVLGDGGENGLEKPRGIAVARDTRIFVSGRDTDNVFQITPPPLVPSLNLLGIVLSCMLIGILGHAILGPNAQNLSRTKR